MTDLMPGNDGTIDKCHMRSVSSYEHLFLSHVTFVVLPNGVFKGGKVNMHLFSTSFYRIPPVYECCVRCPGGDPIGC